jgi:hypothetical protein
MITRAGDRRKAARAASGGARSEAELKRIQKQWQVSALQILLRAAWRWGEHFNRCVVELQSRVGGIDDHFVSLVQALENLGPRPILEPQFKRRFRCPSADDPETVRLEYEIITGRAGAATTISGGRWPQATLRIAADLNRHTLQANDGARIPGRMG